MSVPFNDIRVVPTPPGSAVGQIDFAAKNDAFAVSLASPDSLTASVLFRLPAIDGTVGQLLQTDGAGNWSFSTFTLTPPITFTAAISPAILTLINSGVGLALSVTSTLNAAVFSSSSTGGVTVAQFTGIGSANPIKVNSVSGDGIIVNSTNGQGATISTIGAGNNAIAASSTSGPCVTAGNSSFYFPCLQVKNTVLFDIGIFGYIGSNGQTLATLTALGSLGVPLAAAFCTNAKNILDDGAAPGSIAVAGGHGSMLCYTNGSWRVMC
jgi:hypothetical protein